MGEPSESTKGVTIESVMTSEEGFRFVRDILGVTSPEDKMTSDPKGLLDDVLYSWQQHIPYQTIRSIATPNKERHRPTLLEIKHDIWAKYGGRCYHSNVGCFMVIKALGYQATLVPGDVLGLKSVHVVIIVYNLSGKGSKHMADVGTGGWPTFQLIPLDFEKESPEYHESFVIYKLVRQGNLILRLHNAESDPVGAAGFKKTLKDGWYTYAEIHHEMPVDVSHFDDVMSMLYTEVSEKNPLLSSLWCIAFPNRRLLSIRNTTLLIENEEGQVEKTYFRSREEMIATFVRFFPQYSEDTLNAAMNHENIKLDFNREQPASIL
ncbi:uncharacterized protein [Diadema antillarum]|uniref:uncharacterized protein n=1 Tax=Diadema antillarum TaxID=105358 RepID=UPI003A86A259